jgi:hypothetical protein
MPRTERGPYRLAGRRSSRATKVLRDERRPLVFAPGEAQGQRRCYATASGLNHDGVPIRPYGSLPSAVRVT